MPRKTGIEVSQFPAEISYGGLTEIVTKIETVSSDVTNLNNTNEEILTELGRIRKANELIVGQDVEESN